MPGPTGLWRGWGRGVVKKTLEPMQPGALWSTNYRGLAGGPHRPSEGGAEPRSPKAPTSLLPQAGETQAGYGAAGRLGVAGAQGLTFGQRWAGTDPL